MRNPKFAPITGSVSPRFAGVATLMRLPLLLGFDDPDFAEVDIGLVGVPWDGGDVVEVSPPFDQSGHTAMVGATMAFEILCVLADSLAGRRAAP